MATTLQQRRSEHRFNAGVDHFHRYWLDHRSTWVPEGAVVDGYPLGNWVAARRADARAGRLTQDRLDVLDTRFPGWRQRARLRFADGVAATRRYRDRHGTAMAPADAVVDGFPLGRWQKGRHIEYRAGRIPPQQIAQLAAEFPDWTWTPGRHHQSFDELLDMLRRYGNEHGTTCVPSTAIYRGVPLGTRVISLRSKHRAGRLNARQVAALDELPGWEWDGHEARLEQAIAALYRYATEHGPGKVPRSAVVGDVRIGAWCRARRDELRAGRLNPATAARLEQDMPELWNWMSSNHHPTVSRVRADAA